MDLDPGVDQADIHATYGQLASVEAPPGTLTRRIVSTPTFGAVLRLDSAGRRGVDLEFRGSGNRLNIEQAKGLLVEIKNGAKFQTLSITQTRPGDADMFEIVVADLLTSALNAVGREAETTIQRLDRWRVFFARRTIGLSRRQQLGLFGELSVLTSWLDSGVDLNVVRSWKGPEAEVHDFSTHGWAVEVKATSALGSGLATITNERQLDSVLEGHLYLVFLEFDVRPIGPGETLPQLVANIRNRVRGLGSVEEYFEDRLVDSGYHDLHRDLYPSTYRQVRQSVFSVRQDFPSIRAAEMPKPVSHVTYQLNVDHCAEWEIPFDALTIKVVGAEGGN